MAREYRYNPINDPNLMPQPQTVQAAAPLREVEGLPAGRWITALVGPHDAAEHIMVQFDPDSRSVHPIPKS